VIALLSLGWQIYSYLHKPEPVHSFDEFEIDSANLQESMEGLINDGEVDFWAKICVTNLSQHPGRKMKSEEWTIELQFFEILKRSEILSQKEFIRKTPEFNDGNIKGILATTI